MSIECDADHGLHRDERRLRRRGRPCGRPVWVNLFNVNLEKIMPNSFTEDDIRTKAYELWEQAGCPDGGAGIYWAQAQVILGNGESASPSDSLADVHSPEDTPDEK
jgi:hypothetical protein